MWDYLLFTFSNYSQKTLSTHLVIEMLYAFKIDATQLIICDLLLHLKVALQVINDSTNYYLIPQPSQTYNTQYYKTIILYIHH